NTKAIWDELLQFKQRSDKLHRHLSSAPLKDMLGSNGEKTDLLQNYILGSFPEDSLQE
ncbi:hypothetical protein AVEN_84751-1, partial [Araneus ventricosus]